MHMDLQDRVALVTGGNGGIGGGIARALAGRGATVAVVGRDASKNDTTLRALNSRTGGRHMALRADLTEPDRAAQVVDEVLHGLGRLDIVVANAGTAVEERPESITDTGWADVLDVNLTSVMQICRAAYEPLRASGHGRVVTVGSMLSLFGNDSRPAYAASKGAVVQFTKSVAVAWAPAGITANAILPGFIETPLTEPTRTEGSDFDRRIIERTPMARWGTPDECGDVVAFLAGDGARFVTGAAIPVDGGYSANL